MPRRVAEAGEGGADGYGVYGFIRHQIMAGKVAKFVNKRGRYVLNWPRALDCYAVYKAKKNSHCKRMNQTRRTASNSLRSGVFKTRNDEMAKWN